MHIQSSTYLSVDNKPPLDVLPSGVWHSNYFLNCNAGTYRQGINSTKYISIRTLCLRNTYLYSD